MAQLGKGLRVGSSMMI